MQTLKTKQKSLINKLNHHRGLLTSSVLKNRIMNAQTIKFKIGDKLRIGDDKELVRIEEIDYPIATLVYLSSSYNIIYLKARGSAVTEAKTIISDLSKLKVSKLI